MNRKTLLNKLPKWAFAAAFILVLVSVLILAGNTDASAADTTDTEDLVEVRVTHKYGPPPYVTSETGTSLPAGNYYLGDLYELLSERVWGERWEFLPEFGVYSGDSHILIESGYRYTFTIFYSRIDTVTGGDEDTDPPPPPPPPPPPGPDEDDDEDDQDDEDDRDYELPDDDDEDFDDEDFDDEDEQDMDYGRQQPDPTTPGGADRYAPPVPNVPANTLVPQVGDDGSITFMEFDDFGTPLGEWHYDDGLEMWLFDEYVPLAFHSAMPNTGDSSAAPIMFITLLVISLFLATLCTVVIDSVNPKQRFRNKQ